MRNTFLWGGTRNAGTQALTNTCNRIVAHGQHSVADQSKQAAFHPIGKQRSKNYSTYSIPLCIVNTGCWVTTAAEPALHRWLSDTLHLDTRSDLLTVGVCHASSQREWKHFCSGEQRNSLTNSATHAFSSESFGWNWNGRRVKDVHSYEILLIRPQTHCIFCSLFSQDSICWLFAQPNESGNGSIKDLAFHLVKGRERTHSTEFLGARPRLPIPLYSVQ